MYILIAILIHALMECIVIVQAYSDPHMPLTHVREQLDEVSMCSV